MNDEGTICDCGKLCLCGEDNSLLIIDRFLGITALERKARVLKNQVQKADPDESPNDLLLSYDEKIELATRNLVKETFDDILGKDLSTEDSEALKGILFTIIYPTLE